MAYINVQHTQDQLKSALKDLYFMDSLNIYPGSSDYISSKKELISLFANCKCEQLLPLLGNLDANELEELVKFIPDISKSLGTEERKSAFINSIKVLAEKYPEINFSTALFYAKL